MARTFICLWTPHTQNPSGYIVIFFHERKTKQLLTPVFKASLNYWSSIETWNSPIHWLMLIEMSNGNNFLLATCKWLPSFLFINHCIFVFNLLFIKRFSLLIKRWKTYNEIQYNYPKYTSYVIRIIQRDIFLPFNPSNTYITLKSCFAYPTPINNDITSFWVNNDSQINC